MKRSKLLDTAYSLIDGFNAWDEDQIMACRTDDCLHEFWPPTSPDAKGNDNAAARAHFLSTRNLFKNFRVQIVEEAEDPVAHRVVFFAHATMDTPKGPMVLDYVLLLDISEENDKIKRIVQMNHPKLV